MKKIEKQLLAHFKKQTEAIKLPHNGAEIKSQAKRIPWSRLIRIGVAAALVVATLAVLPLFIKRNGTNGTDVLVDISIQESEAESTEETDSEERDDSDVNGKAEGEESNVSTDDESGLAPPDDVKVVYSLDPNKAVVGSDVIMVGGQWSPNYMKGPEINYWKENGMDSVYYVMIKPMSYAHIGIFEEHRAEYEKEPQGYVNGGHSLETHKAALQQRIDTDIAILESYGIIGMELQWVYPPEEDINSAECCPTYAFVGYVKGELLYNFKTAMNNIFYSYWRSEDIKGTAFWNCSMGGDICVMPEGCAAKDCYYGMVLFYIDGGWCTVD